MPDFFSKHEEMEGCGKEKDGGTYDRERKRESNIKLETEGEVYFL